MRPSSPLQSALAWAIWFVHAPLGMLWLTTAGLAVAGIVSLFVAPHRALHLIELSATVAGCVKVVAHVKGVPASPWSVHRSRGDLEPGTSRHLTSRLP